MSERLPLLLLGVLLSGGFAPAGEDPARLTPRQAASRLRQGIPDGKEVSGRGRAAGAGEANRNSMEEDL